MRVAFGGGRKEELEEEECWLVLTLRCWRGGCEKKKRGEKKFVAAAAVAVEEACGKQR